MKSPVSARKRESRAGKLSGGGGRGDAAALLDELGPWGWAEAWVSSGVGCGREREGAGRAGLGEELALAVASGCVLV